MIIKCLKVYPDNRQEIVLNEVPDDYFPEPEPEPEQEAFTVLDLKTELDQLKAELENMKKSTLPEGSAEA